MGHRPGDAAPDYIFKVLLFFPVFSCQTLAVIRSMGSIPGAAFNWR